MGRRLRKTFKSYGQQDQGHKTETPIQLRQAQVLISRACSLSSWLPRLVVPPSLIGLREEKAMFESFGLYNSWGFQRRKYPLVVFRRLPNKHEQQMSGEVAIDPVSPLPNNRKSRSLLVRLEIILASTYRDLEVHNRPERYSTPITRTFCLTSNPLPAEYCVALFLRKNNYNLLSFHDFDTAR